MLAVASPLGAEFLTYFCPSATLYFRHGGDILSVATMIYVSAAVQIYHAWPIGPLVYWKTCSFSKAGALVGRTVNSF